MYKVGDKVVITTSYDSSTPKNQFGVVTSANLYGCMVEVGVCPEKHSYIGQDNHHLCYDNNQLKPAPENTDWQLCAPNFKLTPEQEVLKDSNGVSVAYREKPLEVETTYAHYDHLTGSFYRFASNNEYEQPITLHVSKQNGKVIKVDVELPEWEPI